MRRVTIVLLAVAVAVGLLAPALRPAEAAFPGRNGKIVFARFGDIWTMNQNGSGAAKLPIDSANAEHNPAVSPDGVRMAYEYSFGIWTIGIDGSGNKQVTDGAIQDTDPAWSPDGAWIAFIRNGDV